MPVVHQSHLGIRQQGTTKGKVNLYVGLGFGNYFQ